MIGTLESKFFISEEEAVGIIERNIDDLTSKIDAASSMSTQSQTGATNIQPDDCLLPGGPPCIQCNGPDPFCQCCQC